MIKKIEPKLGINRHSFRIWGSKGGKIGGAKNKKKGKEYFKKIGKMGGLQKGKNFKSYTLDKE